MKTNKKLFFLFFSCAAIASTLFFIYQNRWIIRFAIRNRVPCVLWTKKIRSNDSALKMITSILPQNPIIIEAGAYDGGDTVKLASMWPKGHVFAFEPVPELYKKVVNTTQGFDNISSYPLALSDKEGTADFFVSSQDTTPDEPYASGSLLAPEKHLVEYPHILFKKKLIIPTTTIDLWANKNNIDHVDFIWLDTQGSELRILKNAIKTLKTVKAVLAEVEFIEAYKNQPLFTEIKEWMENNGFKLEALHLGCDWSGDALFVRSTN